jgi:hypothetical protein
MTIKLIPSMTPGRNQGERTAGCGDELADSSVKKSPGARGAPIKSRRWPPPSERGAAQIQR